MNNPQSVIDLLQKINLKKDEATLYIELLNGPNTHLRLAHATGINRTKVYRIAEDLEKRSLIARRTDDRGTFLVAADPATLEVELVTKEEQIKSQRAAFDSILPLLTGMQSGSMYDFAIHTYDGSEGFKQMLWHELKTKDENLIFGSGSIEDLIDDHPWAEKHRALSVKTNYTIREILNPRTKKPIFTLNEDFVKKHYFHRFISPKVIRFGQQIAVYNDTVAIYNWRENKKVGLEIINKPFADTLRQVFEHYWEIAEEQ